MAWLATPAPTALNPFLSLPSHSFPPLVSPRLSARRTWGSADSRGLRPLPPTPRKRWSLHVPGDTPEARVNFGLWNRQLDLPRDSCSCPDGTPESFPYEFQFETRDLHRCFRFPFEFQTFPGTKSGIKHVWSRPLRTKNPSRRRRGSLGELRSTSMDYSKELLENLRGPS